MKTHSPLFVLLLLVLSCTASDKDKLRGNDYRLFQETPVWELAKALKANDSSKVEKIVKEGKVNLDFQEAKFGETLLMLTVRNRQYEMCKKLLELGANPNLHEHIDGSSAIIDASGIFTDDPDFIKLLLAHGANPNDEEIGERKKGSTRRDTPLINASEESLGKVMVLIEAGADINKKNEFGVTPLRSALMQGKYDIVLYLLEKGVDYKIKISEVEGKEYFLWDELRFVLVPLNSEKYKLKMQIVELLTQKGIDYRKVPIPDYAIDQAKKLYPNNWEDYLNKY